MREEKDFRGADLGGPEQNRWIELPEIDQLRKDELYDLKVPGSSKSAGQMRIMLQWIYSKVKLLEDILLALRYQIHRDQQLKKKKEELLRDMTRPL